MTLDADDLDRVSALRETLEAEGFLIRDMYLDADRSGALELSVDLVER